MPTLFTRIINGELPGRFIYRDALCVAFMTIHPLKPGHTLVVPIEEVEHWIDLTPTLNAHLIQVAQQLGQAQQAVFQPEKVGLLIAGLEVPHVHLHVVPIETSNDLNFANANTRATGAEIEAAAQSLRNALRAQGVAGVVG